MEPTVSNMKEFRCPECGKPVLVTDLPNNQARMDCSPDCKCKTYLIPRGSILNGPKEGPKFIYTPKPTA